VVRSSSIETGVRRKAPGEICPAGFGFSADKQAAPPGIVGAPEVFLGRRSSACGIERDLMHAIAKLLVAIRVLRTAPQGSLASPRAAAPSDLRLFR